MINRILLGSLCLMSIGATAQAADAGALKKRAVAGVETRAKLAQQINDSVFSFAELGYQEVETSRYLTAVLEQNGFKIERGVAGIPTAWVARWTNGQGGPVIALGSDIDCIPKASQKPGIPWHEPLVEGAPGHGEGHNSGQAVNIVAALAVQEIMRSSNVAGTLMLWPGVAEELLGAKAYFVRDGVLSGGRRRDLHARRGQSRRVLGTAAGNGPGVGRVHLPGRGCTLGDGAVAGTQRSRCGRADEHGLGQAP